MSEKTVVVGMDGSGDARAALMFAMGEAAMRRSVLRVAVAVRLPDYGLAAPTKMTLPSPQELIDDVRKAAQTYVDEAVAAYGDGADGLPVEVAVMFGHPGEVLCSSAAQLSCWSWAIAAGARSRARLSGRWDCIASCMPAARSWSSGRMRRVLARQAQAVRRRRCSGCPRCLHSRRGTTPGRTS